MKIAVPRERDILIFGQLRLETKSLKVELARDKLLSFLFRFFLFSRRNTGSISSSGCLSIRKGGRCEASRGPDETGEGGGIYEELTSRLPACIVVKTNNSSDGYGLRGNSPS